MDRDVLIFLEKIEEYLIKSNIYTEVVKEIMNFLAHKILQNNNIKKEDIVALLYLEIETMISKYCKNFDIEDKKKPYVMLICGINGSGKTTTIGKMINLLDECGWDLLVAGCDTYRAAADDQLQCWMKNKPNDFITKEKQTDTPAKIAVKAYNIAVDRNKDILLVDTSGRLQNNQDLMAELLKLKQKLKEISIHIPNDVVLIIDSSCGYNALEQAKIYNDLIGITGIIATKVDIAKRPGIILSICKMFNINVFGICNGEEKDKISSLDPQEFAKAVLCDIDKII